MSNAVDRSYTDTVAILVASGIVASGIVEVLLGMSTFAPLDCHRHGCIDDFGVTARLRFDAAQFGHRVLDRFGL